VTLRRVVVPALVALGLTAGCSKQEPLSPEAERGRQVYQAQCITCHNPDPAQAGPLGPAVRGSSADLLGAKVLQGSYPPDYAPKRQTKVMPPLPQLANDIPALAAYLR
jgi:mono/diheme cytochrome c family protein